MRKKDIRGAYHQAQFDEGSSKIFYFECIIVAVIVGIYFRSWYVGIGTMIGLMLIIPIKIVSFLLAIAFTLFWAFMGWGIGMSIDGIPAGILGAILAFLIGAGVHLSALMYIADFFDLDEKE